MMSLLTSAQTWLKCCKWLPGKGSELAAESSACSSLELVQDTPRAVSTPLPHWSLHKAVLH